MRIGVIGSSGGSVARELMNTASAKSNFLVVTDRCCGLEVLANELSLPRLRISEPDNAIFSQRAKHFFDQHGGVDLIILFYLRLVTRELFDNYPTFNLHPSLLPDYQGFNAIERAHADRVMRFGATLHLVDEHADHGPVVAQVSINLRSGQSVDRMRRISFAQKYYLSLHLLDRMESARDINWLASLHHEKAPMNPSLNNPIFRDYFRKFTVREGLEGSV